VQLGLQGRCKCGRDSLIQWLCSGRQGASWAMQYSAVPCWLQAPTPKYCTGYTCDQHTHVINIHVHKTDGSRMPMLQECLLQLNVGIGRSSWMQRGPAKRGAVRMRLSTYPYSRSLILVGMYCAVSDINITM
jgi:hypothetical protein